MEISSNIVVIAINLIVGIRLLKLGAKRGALPELLLGASLTFDGLEWLFWMLAFYTPLAETPLALYLTAGCRVGILISNLFMLLFICSVFRPTSPAALAFVVLVSSTSWAGLTVGISLGDWAGFAADRIWIWLELGGTLTAYIWCSAEGAMYDANMGKRTRHGLADPVVTNRVLLWSGYGMSGAITELLYMAGVAVAGSDDSYPFIFDAIMIVTTTAGALLILLAFFPPSTYTRWVASNAEASSSMLTTATAE